MRKGSQYRDGGHVSLNSFRMDDATDRKMMTRYACTQKVGGASRVPEQVGDLRPAVRTVVGRVWVGSSGTYICGQ